MSSFRIDRQYVSFEPVVTHHVFTEEPASKVRKREESPDPVDTGKWREDMETYYAKMIEKAQKDAGEKSAEIIGRAEYEAQATVDSAKAQAGRIIDEAKSNAERIRESALTEGYAEGRKAAESEAAARKNDEARALQGMLSKLKNDYSELVNGMQKTVIALVIEIAKKIINIKLKESDEVFLGLINEAMERLQKTGYLIIRVCPQDYARYFGSDSADKGIDAGGAKVVVIEEDGLSPGDLIIESEGEMLDLSINRQIEKIEKAFSEEGS